ncbi:MAG: type II toxin-antitoxin system RelE/ParE family toxin [Planctomycetaceae bacterium]|nr:type II toxin-antitoxin system RelE/ParE family toxin [Planctomycetaceae bacterium]
MNFRVLIIPVHREIVQASAYLEQQAGLGAEFLNLVYTNLDAIEANPDSFPLWESNPLEIEIRRVVLQRFRYIVYFQMIRDEVIVLAVSHASRDYHNWLNRVQPLDSWPDQRNEDQSGGNKS